MEAKPKGAPPVTPKTRTMERLDKGAHAKLGKDGMSRYSGNYAKDKPISNKDEDPFEGF